MMCSLFHSKVRTNTYSVEFWARTETIFLCSPKCKVVIWWGDIITWEGNMALSPFDTMLILYSSALQPSFFAPDKRLKFKAPCPVLSFIKSELGENRYCLPSLVSFANGTISSLGQRRVFTPCCGHMELMTASNDLDCKWRGLQRVLLLPFHGGRSLWHQRLHATETMVWKVRGTHCGPGGRCKPGSLYFLSSRERVTNVCCLDGHQ